eukprot:CAMPEP_0198353354 /NCGR_PEP_ID=MMETSP1450-20131203/111007_1 /TAXON_ID=753684 ORGANISM="Madagascaria erythrocladiodes, Strain CCMP3234" /NCGR_SAMPLE_ID=MMETSP1450 /ASSEMBLY_ACC=CAM_ASM_001115 /LENGTH=456 /DNA_ID=CAMNT_0044059481 /DNA_START=370 /DNA_END=1740 /DNA_ORIENTATION=+
MPLAQPVSNAENSANGALSIARAATVDKSSRGVSEAKAALLNAPPPITRSPQRREVRGNGTSGDPKPEQLAGAFSLAASMSRRDHQADGVPATIGAEPDGSQPTNSTVLQPTENNTHQARNNWLSGRSGLGDGEGDNKQHEKRELSPSENDPKAKWPRLLPNNTSAVKTDAIVDRSGKEDGKDSNELEAKTANSITDRPRRGRQASPSESPRPKLPKLPKVSSRLDLSRVKNHVEPLIGPDRQAEVVDSASFVTPENGNSLLEWDTMSACIWSPDDFVEERLQDFIDVCDNECLRRQGITMTPRMRMAAHTYLYEKRLELNSRVVPESLPDHIFEIAPRWTNSERAVFSRGLAEYGKNFILIQREFLPQRTTNELVSYYYYYYKQTWTQLDGPKHGDVTDRGTEKLPPDGISPNTMLDFLRSFARSPQDGFPPERRMATAVSRFREARGQRSRAGR